MLAWTHWCQSSPSEILLPCGKWVSCDRGAEQGDPLGPAYCACVLAECAKAACEAVEQAGGWVWDAWYMDDGQVLLPPKHAAAYLTAFDQALIQAGGTRIADGVFKKP